MTAFRGGVDHPNRTQTILKHSNEPLAATVAVRARKTEGGDEPRHGISIGAGWNESFYQVARADPAAHRPVRWLTTGQGNHGLSYLGEHFPNSNRHR